MALYERRLHPNSYEDFLSVLEADIEDVIFKMERDSDKYLSSSEDYLTAIVCTMLSMLDYDSVDEQVHKNGAVDLTVRHKKFEWIAEAKLGTTPQKIFEGVLQLVTRYVKRDKDAGILVYYQKALAVNAVNGFISYLNSEKWREASFSKNTSTLETLELCFSSPVFENTTDYSFEVKFIKPDGAEIRVKFFAANFHYAPIDKSGREANYIDQAKAKNQLLEKYHEWSDAEYCTTHIEDIKQALDKYFTFSTSSS